MPEILIRSKKKKKTDDWIFCRIKDVVDELTSRLINFLTISSIIVEKKPENNGNIFSNDGNGCNVRFCVYAVPNSVENNQSDPQLLSNICNGPIETIFLTSKWFSSNLKLSS